LPFVGITALVGRDVKRTFSVVRQICTGLSRQETLEAERKNGSDLHDFLAGSVIESVHSKTLRALQRQRKQPSENGRSVLLKLEVVAQKSFN
jgi:hypothetical protein